MNKYILVDKEPVVEPDLRKWSEWFDKQDRIVAKTELGEYRVSTVFLGLDHNFTFLGDPILFETMVFKGDSWTEIDQARYRTWEEAEAGHKAMVAKYLTEV